MKEPNKNRHIMYLVKNTLRGSFTLCAVLALASVGRAQVPEIITYEGFVTSESADFNGVGHFKFALVGGNPASSSYWSNDDSSWLGSEPISSVMVDVVDGFFMVGLGDTSLENMNPVPAEAFRHPDAHLRIWFDEDGIGEFTLLTPDEQMTSVGYAMMAAHVPADAIDGSAIASGSVETEHLAVHSVTETVLADGNVTTPKLADDAVTNDKVAPNAIGSSHIVNNTVSSSDVADSLTLETLELGGMHWDGSLQLFSQPVDGDIILPGGDARGYLEADASGSEMALFMSEGQTGIELSSRSSGGRLQLWDASKTMTTYLGTTIGGGDLNLFQIDGNVGVSLNGDRATYDNSNSEGGEISVHGRGGGVGLLLDGAHNSAGRIEVRQPTDVLPYVDIFGRGRHDGGEIRVQDNNARNAVAILGQPNDGKAGRSGTPYTGGQIELYQSDSDIGAVLYGAAPNNGAGAISLRNRSGDPRLRLYGGPNAGKIEVYSAGGEVNVECRSTGDEDGVVTVRNSDGNDRVRLWAALNDNGSAYDGGSFKLLESPEGSDLATVLILANEGGEVWLKQADGTSPVQLHANYNGSGEGRVITEVLQITGGSDLSEQFEIETIDRQPEPGMLVCIDPDQPSQLALSTKAYDRTAAGIISGAGGVKPGMLMGQAGSIADGKYPVALTGRVYCNVDADYGSIQPGDLITTSDTPGMGMKVTDHARAQGAIIGKAMTRLESGQGQVLVLVSLQ